MAEHATIARPYAEAAFEIAVGEAKENPSAMASWVDALQRLATVAAASELKQLIGNPQLSDDKLSTFIADAANILAPAQRRFVDLLVGNGRVGVLSAVAEQFVALRDKHLHVLAAEVTSAFPLSEAQAEEIRQTLAKRYGCEVRVTTKVDASLIGGVMIQIGDEVIDSSVRGKLARMKTKLAA